MKRHTINLAVIVFVLCLMAGACTVGYKILTNPDSALNMR